ncbi:WAT1-related protein At5g40240-like isoform X2 [Hibiscus syriacus]|uniref:WAT1-related protein At5g40240-like isoform X2 n=1 Tax=Hibiscus syriacus TaxID=106335 RepID=UPI001921AA61|nr:WAT1-related protein At5g40240-like isoform X2 [Hibiscus syriacus]
MARRYCYNEVLPLTAMAGVECANVGLNILFKEATSKGMSHYIFITYSYALGALLLLPLSFFFFPSRAVLPPLKFHLGARIFLLGLIGFSAQVCAYKGINHSSPTLASAIQNLSPAFTFILAVIFRLETVALRSSSSQAQIMGIIASISGALLVVLYKGPTVFSSPSSSPGLLKWPLESSDPNWVIGGILLLVAYILFSILHIVQTQVMEIDSAELVVAFFFNLCGTIVAVPVSLMAESELSSWRLRPSVAVIAVLYSGVFQSCSSLALTWGLHLKGPVYIAIFSPLSIAIAAFLSAILGDSLHLGSIMGATVISMGFYAVIWGKAKEQRTCSSSGKVPLLEEEDREEQLQ